MPTSVTLVSDWKIPTSRWTWLKAAWQAGEP
jgi:hypothetical protein